MKDTRLLSLFFLTFTLVGVFSFPRFTQAAISPSDISGLQLWLKADSLSLNDGDPIAMWVDGSSNSNNATASGSQRPTYQTSELNGLPVVRFDGGDDLMAFTAVTAFPFTIFAVYNQQLADNTSRALLSNASTWDGVGVASGGNHSYGFGVDNANTASRLERNGNLTDTTFRIYTHKRDWLGVNGTEVTYSPYANAAIAGTGWSLSKVGLNHGGDIAEIIIYDTALSDTDRGNVQDYLAAKYGITIPDPTAPSVTVTNPTADSSVRGILNLEATASDNIGVSGVQFKLDTNTLIGSEDTTSTYGVEWDSGAVDVGAHTISAVARDAAGNYATSTVSFTVRRGHARHTPSTTIYTTGYATSVLVSTSTTAVSTSTPITTPPLSFTPAPSFTKDLYLNLSDPEVKLLQIYLNTHGYPLASSGPGAIGSETIRFGALTRSALIKFQKANKIAPAVGYFGPVTRAFVNSN